MSKARVLIVDDSVVARRLITDALAGDKSLEIVDIAASGKLALAKIPHRNPDIVTLDVHMPEMSGLETLAEIRKLYPKLPIIMFSSLTEKGAVATLDALSLGANDYVTKPSNVENRDEAIKRIKEELIPKIKTFCPDLKVPQPMETVHEPRNSTRTTPIQKTSPPLQKIIYNTLQKINVVAIGVSTGGPNALAQLIPHFSTNCPVPILIVQHMPPIFTRFLAERLTAKSQITVTEAKNGETIKPGQAYIAPGDYHMQVENDGAENKLRIQQEMPENSCRPSVDVLFRSVAKNYEKKALAIILTGMGQDGLRGCESIREKDGQIIAQDEASSVVWGMPGFVVNAGLADKVLPLDEIGKEALKQINIGRVVGPLKGNEVKKDAP